MLIFFNTHPPNYPTVKKSYHPPSDYYGYEYELSNHLNTFYNSFCARSRFANGRILRFVKIFSKKSPFLFGSFQKTVVWVTKGEINLSPAFAVAKGGENIE